jgi:hypothetical protein
MPRHLIMRAQIAKLAGYYLLRCAQSDLVIAFNRLATALKAVDDESAFYEQPLFVVVERFKDNDEVYQAGKLLLDLLQPVADSPHFMTMQDVEDLLVNNPRLAVEDIPSEEVSVDEDVITSAPELRVADAILAAIRKLG